MHLVGHIARLAAHSCHWELPEVTIPSAAVTDQDTEAWSAESYERDISEDRKTRGLLGLVAIGAMIAAAFLGCGSAKADTGIDAYTVTNAPAVCLLLDTDGSSTGVYDALNTLASHGLSVEQASEVLVRAVQGWCPGHAGDLRAFVATYGHGSTVRA